MRIPLGSSSYARTVFSEPELLVLNRYYEMDPTNHVDGVALLSRPGRTVDETAIGSGPIVATYTQKGLFGGDLFVISDNGNLYRYPPPTGPETVIPGTIDTTLPPKMAGVYSPAFDRLFIADGVNLQYFGGTPFQDTLTLTPGAISNDTVEIDGKYYKFTTVSGDLVGGTKSTGTVYVDEGSGAPYNDTVQIGSRYYKFTKFPGAPGTGTQADPVQVVRGTDNGGYSAAALENLEHAINGTGTPGTNYSSAAVVPNPDVEVIASTEFVLSLQSRTAVGAAANAIPLAMHVSGAEDGVHVSGATMTGAAGNPGTLALPYIVFVNGSNTNALLNLLRAVNASGTEGTDYSIGLAQNLRVQADASTATTLSASSREAGIPATNITASVITSGGADGLAWASAIFTAGPVALYSIPTPDDIGISSVAVLKGYILCQQTNSQRVYFIEPGEVNIDALNFFEAESEPDELVDMVPVGDQVWLVGKSTIEPWYVSGELDAPIKPVAGRTVARGALEGTAVKVDDGLVFVGDDYVVYNLGGGVPATVSNSGIVERIRKNPPLATNRSWTFQLDGHKFYVLHLGTVETLVLDLTTKMWSQWNDYSSAQWAMINGTEWNGGVYAGTPASATLFRMVPDSFLDESLNQITRSVVGIYPVTGRDAVSCGSFTLQGFPQATESEETGSQVTLEFSDDGGATWVSAGTLATIPPYPVAAAWHSLGSMQEPMRIFRVTDVGMYSRVNGADILIGKPKTKAKSG